MIHSSLNGAVSLNSSIMHSGCLLHMKSRNCARIDLSGRTGDQESGTARKAKTNLSSSHTRAHRSEKIGRRRVHDGSGRCRQSIGRGAAATTAPPSPQLEVTTNLLRFTSSKRVLDQYLFASLMNRHMPQASEQVRASHSRDGTYSVLEDHNEHSVSAVVYGG